MNCSKWATQPPAVRLLFDEVDSGVFSKSERRRRSGLFYVGLLLPHGVLCRLK